MILLPLPRKIAWRMTIWHSIATLLLMTSLAVALTALFVRAQLRDVDLELSRITSNLLAELSSRGHIYLPEGGGRFDSLVGEVQVQMYDVFLNPVLPLQDPRIPEATLRQLLKAGKQFATLEPTGEETPLEVLFWRRLYRSRRVHWQALRLSGNTYYIVSQCRMSAVARSARNLLGMLLALALPASALSAAAGYWVASRSLKPIREINKTIASIDINSLHQRIEVERTGDEIEELGNHINSMLQKLETSVMQLRQFTSDVSHELRTPISVIKGKAELALMRDREAPYYREKLEDILEQTDRLTALVNALLELARLDATQRIEGAEAVDLSEVAYSALDQLLEAASSRGLEVKARLEPATVMGKGPLLQRLVSNLLDNAIKYTPPGGKVFLRVSRGTRGVILQVGDTGVGMDEKTLERCTHRFYRADSARSTPGYGLGLTIAARIAELHGAQMRIFSRKGKGTLFTLLFPTAERA